MPEKVKAVNVSLEIYNIVGYKALKKSIESLKKQGTIGQGEPPREVEQEAFLKRLKTKAKRRGAASETPKDSGEQAEAGQEEPRDDQDE